MKQTVFKPAVIFSVNTLAEQEQLKEMFTTIKAPFKIVEGCYQDVLEPYCFYIEISGILDSQNLLPIIKRYKQDTILLLNKDRSAYLLNLNTYEKTHIGTFKQTPKDEALQKNAFTYDPQYDVYYTCE